MVLIGLLYNYFTDNLSNFPNHVIRVCKQDVSNIKFINFHHEYSGVNLTSSSNIDLSNLVCLCEFNSLILILINNNIQGVYFVLKRFKITLITF